MSEQAAEQPGTGEPQEPGTGAAEEPQEPEGGWRSYAQKWEKRAKANAEAAKRLPELEKAANRLAELERSQMSEQEKAAARLAEAESQAAEARRDALRFRIATRYKISDEDADLFLTGSDEDTLTRQAERLARHVEQAPRRFGDVGQGPREPAASAPSMNDLIRGNLRGR